MLARVAQFRDWARKGLNMKQRSSTVPNYFIHLDVDTSYAQEAF
jgi:hypothetical protein